MLIAVERQGLPYVNSNDNYELFNQVCLKSKELVRKQSFRLNFDDSSEQLHIFEGNEFRQQQSQQKLAQYINEVCDLLEDIVVMVDNLHSRYDEIYHNRFFNLKKQLRTFKIQLNIVIELLTNCIDGPTHELQKLKSMIQVERNIEATKASHVNIIMVSNIGEFLIQKYFPSILKISKNAIEDFQQQNQLLLKDLKILGTQLLMINLIFSSAVDMDQKSLFSLDRNHEDWKQIYAHTQFKHLGTTEQIMQSFDAFANTILMGHACVNDTQHYDSVIIKKLWFGLKSMYYQIFDVQKDAFVHMSTIKVESALEVFNLIEQPEVKKLISVGFEKIKINKKIYISPVVKPITMEWICHEIKTGQINKITPEHLLLVNEDDFLDHHYKEKLFIKCHQRLRIRILCNDHIEDYRSFFKTQKSKLFDKVLIHIHGGGFIAGSSSSHQVYTRVWANRTGIPIFSIDYSLSPKYPYPAALDDCWQAYHWILLYVHKYFNIMPDKVYITGDSAGGNIAAALTGMAIKLGQRVPDGLLLSYPALDIRFRYSPSFMYALSDKIISHTILGVCISSYTAHPKSQLSADPFINPLMLSDEILAKFPPVRILCGNRDPLYDVSIIFASRLLKQNRDVKLTIYEDMSHGFLNFNTIKGMKETQICVDDGVIFLNELINM